MQLPAMLIHASSNFIVLVSSISNLPLPYSV